MMKCQLNREKTELTIVISYRNGDDAPTSSSGKSVIRASTNGNQPVALDGRQVRLGLNVLSLIHI